LTHRKEDDSWPDRRIYHFAACLVYWRQHPRLFISGGGSADAAIFDDMWLLDPQSGRMENV